MSLPVPASLRVLVFVPLLCLAGCNCGPEPAAADAGTDAGTSDGGRADAGTQDAGTQDAGTPDAGMPDAGPADSGVPDAGPPARTQLFATIGNALATLDTTSGAATPVAPLSTRVTTLAFDPDGGRLFGLVDSLTAPAIVEVDPCTGALSVPRAVTVPGQMVYFAEGLTWDPAGAQLLMSASLNGPLDPDYESEALLAVQPATGAATSLSTISGTLGNEADGLLFVDGVLHAYDAFIASGCPGSNGRPCTPLYALDPTSGAATAAGTVTYHVSGGAVLPGSPVYFWNTRDMPDDNALLAWDLDGGVTTALGPTHAPGDFDGGTLGGMAFVTHRCP